jgi:hypothetical protein
MPVIPVTPDYSRGREIASLWPAWAKLTRHYLKNKIKNKRSEV